MFHDKIWRLNNLYRIVDRFGQSIPFKLNSVQREVAESPHKRKLILKARQLGMSTYAVLDLLDDVLFNKNVAAGIVSYSLEHAQHIYKRIIGHALDTLPAQLKPLAGIISQSAREISFSNGSFLRVDTSLRGGSYQSVLVSEYGKTCARSPQKAEEVVTGTLQAVPQGGKIVIESTGEGNEGFFAEMVHSASVRGNDRLSPMEYQLFFYPWMQEPLYVLEQKVSYEVELTDYFNKIERETGSTISQQQRYWYASQRKVLGDKIRQEFPSTVSEAFLSSSDAYYYAEHVQRSYESNRCLSVPLYDPLLPVHIAMDIGINDLTVIVFFQLVHGEIRIIDYYEDKNKGVDFYCRYLLQDKKYIYGMVFLPHDAARRDNIIVENAYEREFKKLFAGTSTRFLVLPRTDLNLGISHTKIKFDRCVFAISKVKHLLDHLSKYRKKWSESSGRYIDEPLHDVNSNYADAFRYAMQGVGHLETVSNSGSSLDKHRAATDARRKMF